MAVLYEYDTVILKEYQILDTNIIYSFNQLHSYEEHLIDGKYPQFVFLSIFDIEDLEYIKIGRYSTYRAAEDIMKDSMAIVKQGRITALVGVSYINKHPKSFRINSQNSNFYVLKPNLDSEFVLGKDIWIETLVLSFRENQLLNLKYYSEYSSDVFKN